MKLGLVLLLVAVLPPAGAEGIADLLAKHDLNDASVQLRLGLMYRTGEEGRRTAPRP